MRYLIALISGVLCALPVMWEEAGFLSWFAAVPYIVLLLKSAPHCRYRDGLMFSLGYYGVLYHWFLCLYPLTFAGLNAWQSVAMIAVSWIGLTALNGLELALLPLILRLLRLDPNSRSGKLFSPPLIAAAWCVLEWGQTQTWLGVPYFRLALSQTGSLPVLQSTSVFGSLFLSFLIILVNALLAQAWIGLTAHDRRSRIYAAAAALLFAVNYLFGAVAVAAYREDGDRCVRVACIQGNYLSGEKWNVTVAETLDTYVSLTREAASDGARLIVWPETAITVSLERHPDIVTRLSSLARELDVTLFVGAFHDGIDADGEPLTYNSIWCIAPDGTVNQTPYNKQHLVPFGEYLPMAGFIRAVLPVLSELNLYSDNLQPGQTSVVTETEWGKVGGLVCFDSIYEILSVDAVRNGAELIIMATNDSWYKDSTAVYQHNRHAVLRAVENGRYIVRAANTGISSVISPVGQVKAALGALLQGNVVADAVFSSRRTPYSIIGNAFVALCGVGLTAYAVVGTVSRRSMRKTEDCSGED